MKFKQGVIGHTAIAAAMLLVACSGPNDGSSGASDAGTENDADASASRSTPRNDAGKEPTLDPWGWLQLKFDDTPGYACAIATAQSRDLMPPPIEWEPCDASLLTDWPSCRRIKEGWSYLGAQVGWVDENGKAWLGFRRGGGLYLIAEADGPVHHAVRSTSDECRIEEATAAAGRVIYGVRRCDWNEKDCHQGGIGGAMDAPAVVLEKGQRDYRSYSPGPTAFVDGASPTSETSTLTGASFRAWQVNAPVLGSLNEFVWYRRPGIFVGENFYYRPRDMFEPLLIRQFLAGVGSRDFLNYGDALSTAAADFGTDGTDMVWTEAFGRAAYNGTWSVGYTAIAPYTTDPSRIQIRRFPIKAPGIELGDSPFVVGCGRAAHGSYDYGHLSIVRLSDGRSWELPTKVSASVMAMTCDEIFFDIASIEGGILRVRFDDFGAGTGLSP